MKLLDVRPKYAYITFAMLDKIHSFGRILLTQRINDIATHNGIGIHISRETNIQIGKNKFNENDN